MTKPRIVILGAGYGGILAAHTLVKKLHKDDAEIILINRNDYHYLTTELHQPAAGTFPIEKTRIYLNEILNLDRITFIQDEIIEVQPNEQKVLLKNGETTYDHLVIGLGAEPETFGIPGLQEYSFGKWNINAALELNAHIEKKFSDYKLSGKPEDLTFVVGGGGFTGIEFLSELACSIPTLCKKYDISLNEVRLINVESHESILPGFDPTLVELATNYLKGKGIEFFNGVALAERTEHTVVLKDGTVIETGTVVWAAGVRGNRLIERSGFENMRGRVKVNEYLKAPGFENVFIIGDCSLFINEEQNRPYPPTAQISMQMGKRLALNLVETLHKTGKEKPFTPDIKGTVASLGRTYAVGVVYGKKISGFAAVTMKKIIDIRYLLIIGGLKLALKKGRF